VTTGETLAHIETRDLVATRTPNAKRFADLQAVADKSEALFTRTSIQLGLAEQHFDRAQKLRREGDGKRKQLERQRQALKSATTRFNAAKATLYEDRLKLEAAKLAEQAQDNVTDSSVVAPTGGRIVRRAVNVGEMLPSGATVFTMLDTSSIYIEIILPAVDLGTMTVGSDARVVLDAPPNISMPARISSLTNGARSGKSETIEASERSDRTIRVRALLDPEQRSAAVAAMRPGLGGVVYIRRDPHSSWPATISGGAGNE
jgi:HlyD family secretion protein